MRVLKKNTKEIVFLALLTLFSAVQARAGSQGVSVRYAELLKGESGYVLSADIDYRLSDSAIDALRNGIPLYWELQVKILQQRRFLWNLAIAEKSLRFRIQYHALLNMYRVRNENSGEIRNFSTLTAAIDLLSSVRYIKLFKSLKIDPEQRYLATVKVHFDRESLPLPLRPIAYLNPQWYLSSDSYIWLLTN